jgi:hypothetical protein
VLTISLFYGWVVSRVIGLIYSELRALSAKVTLQGDDLSWKF